MGESSSIFTGAIPLLAPHILVIIGILVAALWNLTLPKHKIWTPILSVIFLSLACLAYGSQFGIDRQDILMKLYTVDKLSVSFGVLSCLVGIITILMSMGYERKFGPNAGEYYTILLTAVVSVMFLAGTADLIMLFVALETLTVCCVLLSGFAKRDVKSNEAALKYLLSTAATTATFMYGLSFLYGLTGLTNYYEIQQRFFQLAQSPSLVIVFLMVLLISVIGFKLSMVPFHMWTPDVYEGAPTPVTAFLSVGSKLGGLVVALRLMTSVFSSASDEWAPVIGLFAMLSMVVGNLIALSQTSVKRMLAYSSIAHVGYMLIGLCANSGEGLSAMVYYIIIYGFMNLGAFTAAIMIENEIGSDHIDDYAGLIRKRPWLSIAMAVCLLNLAGLPIPPAGFLAKVFIFWSGFQMYSSLGNALVVVGLLTSVPAVFYYSRVAIKMIVKEPSVRVAALPESRLKLADSQAGPLLALVISLIGIIMGSISVAPIMGFSSKAVGSLVKSQIVGTLPEHLK